MTIKGIDISNWQKGISLSPLDIDFMICKATEGLNYVDPTCNGFISQAKNKGIVWGYYHFARENDAAKEAEFFYNNTKNYSKQGIPVLDYEVWGRNSDVAWCEKFLQRYHDLSGVWCMLYISASHCRDFNGSWIPDKCSLWVAGYPKAYTSWPDSKCPYSIAPWKVVTIWQFSSSLRLSGYGGNIDGDFAYVDKNGWKKIAGSETPKIEQNAGNPVNDAGLYYQAHVQNYGWLPKVHDGQVAGIVGHSLRLEALKIDPPEGLELEVKVYIQDEGWKSFSGIKHGNNTVIGTTNKALRVEDIIINVIKNDTGKTLKYRVHRQSLGWGSWFNSGEAAGSVGMSNRIEAIQIKLV